LLIQPVNGEQESLSIATQKNPTLKKRRTSYVPLFCNQNHSVVIFHPLKEILLRAIFPTKQEQYLYY